MAKKKKIFEFGVSREAQIVIEAHTVTDSGTAVVFFFFFFPNRAQLLLFTTVHNKNITL